MAKKQSAGGFLYSIVGFLAFTALFLNGLIGTLGLFDITLPAILGTIASWFLIATVAIAGWNFLMSTNLPGPDILWTILFIVFVILSLTGTIGSLM